MAYRKKKITTEWKTEQEMQDFLHDLSNGALKGLLGVEIKEIKKEVVLPFGRGRKIGGLARVDIVVIDIDGGYHLIEIKNPKNDILDNSKGIAQLLFYDALMAEKHGIEVKSMNLVTSSFDKITKEVVPRNRLRVRIAELHRDCLNIITSFQKKDGSTYWKPIR